MIRQLTSAVVETIRPYGWLPLSVLLAHEVCAHVIDGYRRWPSVDIPLHFFGGLAIAFFVSGTISVFTERRIIQSPEPVIRFLLMFGLTCAAAMFWEFAEWTADHTIGTTCQLGLDDTVGDMVVGVLGGMSLAIPKTVQMINKK